MSETAVDTSEAPEETEVEATEPEATEAPEEAEPAASDLLPRLGTGDASGPVLLLGGSSASRERLERARFEVSENPEEAERAAVALVSTRLPRGKTAETVRRLRRETSAPILALVHPGGEDAAVGLQRAGADAAVAEGAEPSVRSYLDPDSHTDPTHAVRFQEAYEAQADQGVNGSSSSLSVDPVTLLPTGRQLEERIAALADSGEPTRIAFLRVEGWNRTRRRLAADGEGLLRRRLAVRFADATRRDHAELYSLGGGDFAAVGVGWAPTAAGRTMRHLTEIAATFVPAGNEHLQLNIGHVGPELTTDVTALRELATRALRLAGRQEGSTVVGPDELVRTLAPSTEIEAALRLLDHIERDDPHGPGHGQRVGAIAAELASRLRLDAPERATLRLAGHLHDVGKGRLEAHQRFLGANPSEEQRWAYRAHPELGAAYLLVPAGPEVAAAVRHHHERWDGTGFPEGLAGEAIPLEARVVALADRIEHLRRQGHSDTDVTAQLSAEAGSAFDPTLVEVGLELLGLAEEHEQPSDIAV